jgi:hypothetical protein
VDGPRSVRRHRGHRPGDEAGSFRRHYFDSRGEQRIDEMTLDDGWEKAPDGSTWEPDLDRTYRKMT